MLIKPQKNHASAEIQTRVFPTMSYIILMTYTTRLWDLCTVVFEIYLVLDNTDIKTIVFASKLNLYPEKTLEFCFLIAVFK